MSNFSDVGDFHDRFGLHSVHEHLGRPVAVSEELRDFRIRFLEEELSEIKTAAELDDLPKLFDGLLDLAYVTFGMAHVYGFPWQDGWDAVQVANMAKERCLRAVDSTRGSTYDVIKPPGWTSPDIAGILKKHGWPL